ncbi:MAG: integrase arm-type DNA-binding domain-containing protein [Hyphomicrobiaceae bacterium]|nr:integrase arm-type DNA-binding domain-containing protein [Hyphomicrobiaceae bacterium]
MRQLTARFVESVRTNKLREEIRDKAVDGLELRVTRTGTKTWCLRYRRARDGRKCVLTIGRYPDYSLVEARNAAAEARCVIARGGDPAGDKQEHRQSETFADLAQHWLTEHCEIKKRQSSIQNDRSILKRHLLPRFGGMRANDITRRDISQLLALNAQSSDRRFATGDRSRKTRPTRLPKNRRTVCNANRVFAVVRAMYRWGLAQGLVDNDPTWGVRAPVREPTPRTRVLSDAELMRFWFGLEDAPIRKIDRIMFRLAVVTGQRIGEVAGLAKRELDLSALDPVWTISGARTKSKVPHKVWLSPLAVELIRSAEALSGASEWLFPLTKKDRPMRTPNVVDITKVVRPVVCIDDFVPHDLRRTAATYLGEHDIPDRDIEGVLNHVSGRGVTRRHYDHAVRERGKRKAMMLWSEHLEGFCLRTIVSHLELPVGCRY